MITSPRSAYLHIPFCHRRCFYCDFAVVPLGDKAGGEDAPGSSSIKAYLELLHREINLIKEGFPLSTVYIGGGTPSLLTPAQINSLLELLRNLFGFQYGAEITLEVDPASFNKSALADYLEIGINRLSLGGQSFDDDLLLKMGRRHTRNQLFEACNWIDEKYQTRKLSSWSFDLIRNLPGHDLASWNLELQQVIETAAPHLSIYDLSIEPGTVFDRKHTLGEIKLPNENIAVEIDNLTSSKLRKLGFARYEISNYALPGHASRHNRVYWGDSGWWGFGMGATSSPWGQRFSRPRTRDGYKSWIEEQEALGLHSSLLERNARPMDLDEQLIVGLRRREGINLEAIAKDWGWNINQREDYLNALRLRWKDFLERGFMIRQGERIVLTNPKGMELSNQILIEMMIWWDSLPEHAVIPPSL